MSDVSRFASGPRTADVTRLIAALAERQWGVVDRAQLECTGVSNGAIARAVKSGRLHPVHPTVYAVGHRAVSVEGRLMAALLYAGPGAVLSHTTAAWWWSLIHAPPRRIHVSAPGRRRSLRDVCVHRPRSPSATNHRRMPVTAVARTLLDCANACSTETLRRALAEADFRGLLDDREVELARRSGHHGARALGAAVARHRPELARTRSALERRFIGVCEQAGIPAAEVNAVVCGVEVDALWQAHRVIVELDGQAAHGGATWIVRDRDRELRLRRAGYVVLRYSWRQITREPEAVASDLKVALRLIPPAPSAGSGPR